MQDEAGEGPRSVFGPGLLSRSRLWRVVGSVAAGLGCAEDLPPCATERTGPTWKAQKEWRRAHRPSHAEPDG
jgi:hypothetical protein